MSRSNNDVQVDVSRLRKMSLIANPRGIEHIESSHRSILAREAQKVTTTQARSRQTSKASSTLTTSFRQPHTPVPSLVGADDLSPTSAMTRSPITPTFDGFSAYPQSPPSSSNPRQAIYSSETGRPQEMYPYMSSQEQSRTISSSRTNSFERHDPHAQASEEISFIDWDDDPTKLQRMKQSFGFNRPNRPKKLDTSLLKSPDWHINAVPRITTQKNGSEKFPPAQAQPAQTQLPSPNFSRPRRSPQTSQMPPPSFPPPISDRSLSNENRRRRDASSVGRDKHSNDTYTLSRTAVSEYLPHGYPHQEEDTSTSGPLYAVGSKPTQYRNWDDYEYDMPQHEEGDHMTSLSPQVTNESNGGKTKRIRAIMQGVAKRVSMRDMRKEFERK